MGTTSRRIVLLTALALVAAGQLYFLTDRGAKSLLRPDGRSQYYDAAADSALQGRLAVHPVHVGNEAYLIDGRCYGYFGLTPALLRIPLHLLFPRLWGCWSRIIILASGLATSIFTLLIFREARRVEVGEWLEALVLVAYGLGTTTLFLACRTNVFHEAIAMAVALALATFWCLLRYLSSARLRWALAALALCLLTVHTRPVEGVATAAALASVLVAILAQHAGKRLAAACGVPPIRNAALHASVLFLGLGAITASHLAVQYAKFGRWTSLPYEKHVQIDAERLARTSGRMFSLANVPSNAYHYLSPTMIRFRSEPPFIAAVPPTEMRELLGASLDWKEPLVGLSVASPVIFLAALLGGFFLIAARPGTSEVVRLRLPLLGCLISSGLILTFFGLSMRYAHDFFPALVLAGAVAAARVPRFQTRSWWVVAGTLWSIVVWTLVARQYQNDWSFVKIEPNRSVQMIPVYERYIDEHGDDALLETELGVLARQQGDEQAAFRHLRRAIEIDPESDEALSVLGAMTIPTDAAGAEALLLRALRANPHNLRARWRLADLQEASGRRREALENLEAAVRSEPFDPRAQTRLREALEREGRALGEDALRQDSRRTRRGGLGPHDI